MSSGIQIVAPRGYGEMRKGQRYHLLRSDGALGRVLLVTFVKRPRHAEQGEEGWRSEVAELSREDYEAGLVAHRPGAEPAIQLLPDTASLPPWLTHLEGISFLADPKWSLREVLGRERDQSPLERIEARLLQITPAVEQCDSVLGGKDPDRVLNTLAKAAGQIESRFRRRFYTYIAFSYNAWALLPSYYGRNGKWDRQADKYEGSQFGAPSLVPNRTIAKRITSEMIELMIKSFRKHGPKEGTMMGAWAEMVIHDFGGRVIAKPGERPVPHQPDGLQLPSFDSFYYHIRKRLGAEVVSKVLYGEQTVDYRQGPVKGNYWDSLGNFGERVNMDSTKDKSFPKSYVGNYQLPPLNQVEAVDGLTSQIAGIGFALGAEDSRAYKMALFCMAIPKSKFGEIIGFPIADEDWPGYGLPAEIFTDNGPGASADVSRSLKSWPVSVESSPALDPKANSTVEGAHTKRKKRVGQQLYLHSDLTVIEHIRKAARDAIAKNKSKGIMKKVPAPAVILEQVNCPNSYQKYLEQRHRTSVIKISFEDAVRAFLEKVDFSAQKGILSFTGMRYHSQRVIDSGLGLEIRNSKKSSIKAYVLPAVRSYAWIDFRGELIEVRAMAEGDEAMLSSEELEQIDAARSRASGELQRSRPWEEMAKRQDFYEQTGKRWTAGKWRTSRPKLKTKEVEDEMRRLKSLKNKSHAEE